MSDRSSRWMCALVVLAAALAACGDEDAVVSKTVPANPPTATSTNPGTPPPTTPPRDIRSPTTGAGPATTDVPTTTPVTTNAPVTTAFGGITAGAAERAFRDWVEALAAEDTRLAWDLMAESSQRSIGGYDVFADWASALVEGWGAWAAVDDLVVTVEQDSAGRTMARIRGTVTREGMTEEAETTVFLVEDGATATVSPFEEFGNVARGLKDDDRVPLPEDSGTGRRIVYANGAQRVWVVEADGTVADTYLVSGRLGVPDAGEYQVFSKSETAYAGHDGITMRFMVRFARSPSSGLAIGFHSIPNRADGSPLQTEEQLGEFHSAGCVRQSFGHAAALYEWAEVGTTVVVVA